MRSRASAPQTRTLLIAVVVAAIGATAAEAGPAGAPLQRVTFIGDSIATSIADIPQTQAILARGIDLDLQVAVCRRLVDESCPYQGTRPLNLVDLLPTLRLGSTVVVAVGYNDHVPTFAQSIEATLDALREAGVEHVLWLTLRAIWPSYLDMNDDIRAAAARHPEMTIVDWNLYSRSHPDWFQDDGLHLNYMGALAMATLVHKRLDDLGLVARPAGHELAITTRTLPAGRVGRAYQARLRTSGGAPPLRWAREAGSLPAGVSLRRDGLLSGLPRIAGRLTPTLRVTDAKGRSVSRRFVLVVALR